MPRRRTTPAPPAVDQAATGRAEPAPAPPTSWPRPVEPGHRDLAQLDLFGTAHLVAAQSMTVWRGR